MNVLIAGGTGFIGKHLIRDLIDNGHNIILIRRQILNRPIPEHNNIRILNLDPGQEIVAKDISADAIINLVGIIREFPSRGITFNKAHFEATKNLVDFACKAGIPRFLQMSALGARPDTDSGYMRSKHAAEKYIQKSGLGWIIFRPSVVFGPDDHLVSLFHSLIRKFPVIGVVGDGEYKLQPVYVSDVTAGFVKALADNGALGRIFEFGGPEIMTFNHMLDIIGEVIGRSRVRKFHIPVGLLKLISSALERFPRFPISSEQIDLLLKGSYTEDNSYYDFVKRVPIPFKRGISKYLAVLK